MPVTPRLNPVPAPKAPHLMRSSDTPASQQTVVNGRIAGYGVSPSHSYEAHSQGEQFLFFLAFLECETFNVEIRVKSL
jgi:hypothetical protein